MTEHERAIIDLFMRPDRRDRLHFIRERNRRELVEAIHTAKYLDPAVTIPVVARMGDPASVLEVMRKYGATPNCYALSVDKTLDANILPLQEALRTIAGTSTETILYCPGTHVAYYEGSGYQPRYVLHRQ